MFPSTAVLAGHEKSDRKITFGELQTVRPCQHDPTEEQIHNHAKRKVQESWKGKNPIDERIRCKRVAKLLEEIQKWQMYGDVGLYGKPDANMRILCDLPRCIQRNQSIDEAADDARPGQERKSKTISISCPFHFPSRRRNERGRRPHLAVTAHCCAQNPV